MPSKGFLGGGLSASVDNGLGLGGNKNHVELFAKRGNGLGNVVSGNKSFSSMSGGKSVGDRVGGFTGVKGSEFIKKIRDNEMRLPNPEIQENTENSESEELSHEEDEDGEFEQKIMGNPCTVPQHSKFSGHVQSQTTMNSLPDIHLKSMTSPNVIRDKYFSNKKKGESADNFSFFDQALSNGARLNVNRSNAHDVARYNREMSQ
jgi:hypothetical protein